MHGSAYRKREKKVLRVQGQQENTNLDIRVMRHKAPDKYA